MTRTVSRTAVMKALADQDFLYARAVSQITRQPSGPWHIRSRRNPAMMMAGPKCISLWDHHVLSTSPDYSNFCPRCFVWLTIKRWKEKK